jgi:hypothetical protein
LGDRVSNNSRLKGAAFGFWWAEHLCLEFGSYCLVTFLRVGLMSSLVVIGEFRVMYCKGGLGWCFDVLFNWLMCFHHFTSLYMIQQFLLLLVYGIVY